MDNRAPVPPDLLTDVVVRQLLSRIHRILDLWERAGHIAVLTEEQRYETATRAAERQQYGATAVTELDAAAEVTS